MKDQQKKLVNMAIVAVLSFALLTAITVSNYDISAAKPDKPGKPQKCNVKVQVKVNNAPINSTVTVSLAGLSQQKIAEEPTLAFNLQFKKGSATCPVKGDVLSGTVNESTPFTVTIKDTKGKPNKVSVNL